MNPTEITTQISTAANILNIDKWDYGASFSNDYSVQVDRGAAKQLKASQKPVSYTHLTLPTKRIV